MAAMATALLVLLLGAPAAYGATYTVGDTAGWNAGVDYTTWASDKTFTVGDTLVFNYDTSHKVDEVNEDGYNSCSSANVLKSHGDTKATIELSKAGSAYFICPTPGHCSGGMKLKVDVKEATTSPTTPTSSSPPPPSGSSSSTPTAENPPPPPSPSGAASIVSSMNLVGGSVMLAVTILLTLSWVREESVPFIS